MLSDHGIKHVPVILNPPPLQHSHHVKPARFSSPTALHGAGMPVNVLDIAALQEPIVEKPRHKAPTPAMATPMGRQHDARCPPRKRPQEGVHSRKSSARNCTAAQVLSGTTKEREWKEGAPHESGWLQGAKRKP